MTYFNLDAETIKENCKFKFYYNKTDITSTVLDGGNEWPNDKNSIEVNNHFLLESLAACENANSKLTMYFTVNKAFVNYLDKAPNLTESLEFLVVKERTMFEQMLPISLNISKFDPTLLTAPSDLKEFINS